MPLAELHTGARSGRRLTTRTGTILAFLQSSDGGLGMDVARDTLQGVIHSHRTISRRNLVLSHGASSFPSRRGAAWQQKGPWS